MVHATGPHKTILIGWQMIRWSMRVKIFTAKRCNSKLSTPETNRANITTPRDCKFVILAQNKALWLTSKSISVVWVTEALTCLTTHEWCKVTPQH